MILVTGGAGFIGSHVNQMLYQAGYSTIVLDDLSKGHREAVKHGIFIQGNMGDIQLLEKIFEQYPVSAVMHFAAFINVGESIQNPIKYYLNNVVNTIHLLTTMVRYGIKAFVFSSSAAIFGIPSTVKIQEDHPSCPINPYGESKWMVEKILEDFDIAYGVRSCALRYFNAAGGDPEFQIKYHQKTPHNLIPLILAKIKYDSGEHITIFGTDYPTDDGSCIRDYVHVQDLGVAHILALKTVLKGSSSTVYNLGSGKGFSVREVIRTIEQVLQKSIPIVEGKKREGDPPILLADSSKAKLEMGWQPSFSLEQMIEHAWKALEQ